MKLLPEMNKALDSRLRGNDGIFTGQDGAGWPWIPACAGMTVLSLLYDWIRNAIAPRAMLACGFKQLARGAL